MNRISKNEFMSDFYGSFLRKTHSSKEKLINDFIFFSMTIIYSITNLEILN